MVRLNQLLSVPREGRVPGSGHVVPYFVYVTFDGFDIYAAYIFALSLYIWRHESRVSL